LEARKKYAVEAEAHKNPEHEEYRKQLERFAEIEAKFPTRVGNQYIEPDTSDKELNYEEEMKALEEQVKQYTDNSNESMLLFFTAELGPFFIVFSTLTRFMLDPLYRAIILSGIHSYKLK